MASALSHRCRGRILGLFPPFRLDSGCRVFWACSHLSAWRPHLATTSVALERRLLAGPPRNVFTDRARLWAPHAREEPLDIVTKGANELSVCGPRRHSSHQLNLDGGHPDRGLVRGVEPDLDLVPAHNAISSKSLNETLSPDASDPTSISHLHRGESEPSFLSTVKFNTVMQPSFNHTSSGSSSPGRRGGRSWPGRASS